MVPLEYLVVPLDTGFFLGTLDAKKLEAQLNQHGSHGWRFARSIHETRRSLGIFRREAHFLVFERAA